MANLSHTAPAAPFPTSDVQATSVYLGKFGVVLSDPANPRDSYMLVDCQQAFAIGEVVVIDVDGLASRPTSTSVGQLGMVVATVSGSDTAAWVQVTGEWSACYTTSDVTTGALLLVPVTSDAGYFGILTSSGGNAVIGARAISAPSTATSPAGGGALATVYVGMGGAWVNGVSVDLGLVS